jgi:hypothetical protein
VKPWHGHCKFTRTPAQPEVIRVRFLTSRFLLIPALAVFALAAWPQEAAAQRRGRVYGPRVIVRGGVYRPIHISPWYRYGFPWHSYGYQFGYPYPYPPYRHYAYDQTSSVRLEVTPREAEVYVDGSLAGVVDDFDGFFQRLRVWPGEHEIVLYLDGYRTVRQQLYLGPRADQKIRHTMVPLQPGEAQEPRPVPSEPLEEEQANQPPMGPPGFGPGPGGPGPGAPPPVRPLPPGAGPATTAPYGSLSIRVQPADASVLIDGEPWSAPAGQDRLVVQLPAGRHRVEIRKDGYEAYTAEVEVVSGQAVPLNVSLLQR